MLQTKPDYIFCKKETKGGRKRKIKEKIQERISFIKNFQKEQIESRQKFKGLDKLKETPSKSQHLV